MSFFIPFPLNLIEENRQVNYQNTSKTSSKTIIIGIGTGRCGTLALSKLLSAQLKSEVFHEHRSCRNLEWTRAKSPNGAKLAELRYKWFSTQLRATKMTLVGDVALWYLPYIEYFLKHEDVKVVVLKRNKTDTVRSFEKWFGKIRHFPWTEISIKRNWKNEKSEQVYNPLPLFDNCYPKFRLDDFRINSTQAYPTINQGAEVYYDYYYSRVDILLKRYPCRIKQWLRYKKYGSWLVQDFPRFLPIVSVVAFNKN